jgi:integrase
MSADIESFSKGHTPGHIQCPVCERAFRMQGTALSPELNFREAFEIWIGQRVIGQPGQRSRVRYVSERTERDLRQYARAAGRFFDEIMLRGIHAGHLREYQKARALNFLLTSGRESRPWEHPAGANLIRKEIQTVIRVLRAAGAWSTELEESFEPLKGAQSEVGRAMTPEEQHAWLHTAATREEWRVVYCWSIVALQTTAATNEVRSLRLGDVFLAEGILEVRAEGAKNKFRIRTIPLETPEVTWALGTLMERAKGLGATDPYHYLFPIHITADRYDPLKPMTVWGMRKPWDAVREKTGLTWLRMYDLRHTAITRMAEAGVPIQVIMSFAGHISPRMQQHYTAISMQAKRRWAAAAWAGVGPFAATMPDVPGVGKEPGRERRAYSRTG